jgi:hypothetical protein
VKTFILLLLVAFTIVSCENDSSEPIYETPKFIPKQSVVFIAGIDEDDSMFYKNVKAHFSKQKITIVEDLYTLDAIIVWLNEHANDKVYDKIHIVSNSNAWRGMALQTAQEGKRITSTTLEESALPKSNKGISEHTNIIFHSCGLGANKDLMKALKAALSSDVSPNLYASEFFDVFGGKYASHYLARPFYVFYPTANSPGNNELSEELAHKYRSASLDWLTALDTREETTSGAVYSYRFNIPIDWEIVFDNESEIPELKDADTIMDWILENDEFSMALYELGIPMEKFRWTSSSERNILKIKGKTTVLTVLMPVMNTYEPAEYTTPDVTHPRLYTKM